MAVHDRPAVTPLLPVKKVCSSKADVLRTRAGIRSSVRVDSFFEEPRKSGSVVLFCVACGRRQGRRRSRGIAKTWSRRDTRGGRTADSYCLWSYNYSLLGLVFRMGTPLGMVSRSIGGYLDALKRTPVFGPIFLSCRHQATLRSNTWLMIGNENPRPSSSPVQRIVMQGP